MKTKNRRQFIITSTKAGIAGCALMACPNLSAFGINFFENEQDIPDPKKRCYCGYKCPDDCKFLKGSVENNIELKKEAYKDWKIKERFGVEFDADKIFCYGCKNADKPEGIVLKNCTVRQCASSKGLDCCIECDELTACEKELWDRFPEFKKGVIELQKQYQQSQGKS